MREGRYNRAVGEKWPEISFASVSSRNLATVVLESGLSRSELL